MMTIREYLDGILETEGFDAYIEAENTLIEAYEADEEAWVEDIEQDTFGNLCAQLGIDVEAMDGDYSVVTRWMWDWCGD